LSRAIVTAGCPATNSEATTTSSGRTTAQPDCFAARFADVAAFGKQECVRHSATDDQRVDFLDQMFEHLDFGRNLCSADDGHHRAFWIP
jgi:hypothetical protein